MLSRSETTKTQKLSGKTSDLLMATDRDVTLAPAITLLV